VLHRFQITVGINGIPVSSEPIVIKTRKQIETRRNRLTFDLDIEKAAS